MRLSIIKNWWSSINSKRVSSVNRFQQYLITFFCLVLFSIPVSVFAQDWEITEWRANCYIWNNGVISIAQNFNVVFQEGNPEVDLYIPTQYIAGSGRIKVKNLHIYNEQGEELGESQVTISYVFDRVNVKFNTEGEERNRSWQINYDLERAVQIVNNDDSFNYFEWKVVTAERDVVIKDLTARIILPKSFKDNEVQQSIMVGAPGEMQKVDSFEMSGNTLIYHGQNIQPWNDFVVTAQWPRGYVETVNVWWVASIWGGIKYPYYFSPFAVFIFLVVWFLKYGRDPRSNKKIAVQYEPPSDISPEHLGALVEERVKVKFIIVMLVNLAQRGYIHINEEDRQSLFAKSDYTFQKRKEFKNDKNLSSVEHFFLESLFEFSPMGQKTTVKLSTLKNRFASKMNNIRSMILQDLVDNRYFREHPKRSRMKYFIVAASLCCIALPTWLAGGILFHNNYAGTPLFICAFLFLIFAPFMPQKTKKGALAHEWAEGFRLFLKQAKKYKNIRLTPELFDKYLPYAMVFGLEKDWAKSFEGLLSDAPDWYSSAGVYTTFSAIDFSHALSSSFTHAAAQTMQSVPGSHGVYFHGDFRQEAKVRSNHIRKKDNIDE